MRLVAVALLPSHAKSILRVCTKNDGISIHIVGEMCSPFNLQSCLSLEGDLPLFIPWRVS